MDEMITVLGIVVAFAPAFALVWIKIADVTKKSMDSADEMQISEKAGSNGVPK